MKDWKAKLALFFLHITVECLFYNRADAGSPKGEITSNIQDKMKQSSVVIYGQVRQCIKAPLVNSRYYTATMSVFCTLKGPQQPPYINISDAGSVMGRGFQVQLDKGKDYIVFMSGKNNLIPTCEPALATSDILQLIASMCSYSGGLSNRNDSVSLKSCPAPKPSRECSDADSNNTTKLKDDLNKQRINKTVDHSSKSKEKDSTSGLYRRVVASTNCCSAVCASHLQTAIITILLCVSTIYQVQQRLLFP